MVKFINEIFRFLSDILGLICSFMPLFVLLVFIALFTVIPWGIGISEMFKMIVGK